MAMTFIQQFSENLTIHPYLTLVAFLSFIILIYKWLYTNKNSFPSPPKVPILGNLHQLGKLPHRSLQSLANRYGDIVSLHLGSKSALLISSASAAEEIMKTHDTVFSNRPYSKVACIVLYDGRDIGFSKYGDYHRQIKSISIMHLLSNKKVQSFRNIRAEESALMIEQIKGYATSSMPVNLSEVFTRITNNMISRKAFGRKYAGEQGCANIRELLNGLSKVLGEFSIGDFVPWLEWIDQLTGVERTAKKVAKAFDEFIEKIVREHEELIDENGENDDKGSKEEKFQDMVDVLLKIQRNDSSLERDSIKAILLDMLTAGIETTSTLLEWTMSELLMHPNTMKQLQREIRGIVKGKTTIDEDDLKEMKFLKAVIKEGLRLHPPLPLLLFREASDNVKIRNHDVPAGTQVIVNAWAVQRDPTSWEEPNEFRPERFLKSSMDFKGQDLEYIPFGAGRRSCPGTSFGIAMAELILANLVGEFDWEVPGGVDGTTFMAEVFGTSVHRRDPLLVTPTLCFRN